MRIAVALLVAFSTACATTPVEKCQPARAGLSFEEAKAIVADFEARQLKQRAASPLREPKSLDDVLEILKLDDMTFFAAGVKFALEQDGVGARALAAQTELAWGDAQLAVGRLMNELAARLETVARTAEQKNDPSAVIVRDQLRATRGVAEALARLASEHFAAGRKLARDVIDAAPRDYQGYRVAADYYRLREEWSEFDAMVGKLAELNPESNGLGFLRGVAALERDGDAAKAQALLRTALEKDPKFVRAQAQLVRTQPTLRDAYMEFRKLKELSPNHQLVVWAGEYMETAWAANQRERGLQP